MEGVQLGKAKPILKSENTFLCVHWATLVWKVSVWVKKQFAVNHIISLYPRGPSSLGGVHLGQKMFLSNRHFLHPWSNPSLQNVHLGQKSVLVNKHFVLGSQCPSSLEGVHLSEKSNF